MAQELFLKDEPNYIRKGVTRKILRGKIVSENLFLQW